MAGAGRLRIVRGLGLGLGRLGGGGGQMLPRLLPLPSAQSLLLPLAAPFASSTDGGGGDDDDDEKVTHPHIPVLVLPMERSKCLESEGGGEAECVFDG